MFRKYIILGWFFSYRKYFNAATVVNNLSRLDLIGLRWRCVPSAKGAKQCTTDLWIKPVFKIAPTALENRVPRRLKKQASKQKAKETCFYVKIFSFTWFLLAIFHRVHTVFQTVMLKQAPLSVSDKMSCDVHRMDIVEQILSLVNCLLATF